MHESISVITYLGQNFKLSIKDAHKTDDDMKIMDNVPYASCVDSLMYVMLCSRSDLAYDVNVISMFMADPELMH